MLNCLLWILDQQCDRANGDSQSEVGRGEINSAGWTIKMTQSCDCYKNGRIVLLNYLQNISGEERNSP